MSRLMGRFFSALDAVLTWLERLERLPWGKPMSATVMSALFGLWAWLWQLPAPFIALGILGTAAVTAMFLTYIPPLLRSARAPTFAITAHPASFAQQSASLPIFIVNQSAHNRLVLEFMLCIPLSNGNEHRSRAISLGDIKPGLGPQEHTSGHLSFILGSPRGDISFLFHEACLLVTDHVSTRSAKVKIPGYFPSK